MGQLPRNSSRAQPGQRVAHYEILDEIGRGGMGVVYSARDLTLGRRVALKCPLAGIEDDPRQRKRLLREARAASRLSHPHIVPVFEVLEHEGIPWLAMELVDGVSLRNLLAGRQLLPLNEVLGYAEGLASALETAHGRSILHRDINPNNVMIGSDGRALIMDFGLARVVRASETSSTHTRDSDLDGREVVGTFRYMSPEQALGKPLDARSDLFSLGAVIYEMCTGEPAFPGEGPEVLDALLHRPPVPISRFNYQVPEELERIVRKALAKDRDERYQSARDLVVDLRSVRRRLEHHDYVEVHPLEAPPTRSRRAAWLTAAAGLVLLSALAMMPALYSRRQAATERRSIAVLPLKNLSADPENEYFSDGITDDIIAQLSKIGDLKVISGTSVKGYKNRDTDRREIGRELGVAAVLEGSVRRAGNRVRIASQLIDTHTGEPLWAETYDRQLEDIFAIQSEVSREIAVALKGGLSAFEKQRLKESESGDFEVFDLYLRGRYHWNQRTKEGLEKSIKYFEQAIERDPRYARAHAGIADSYLLLATYGFAPRSMTLSRARAAAMKALELDETLGEAHASLALVQHKLLDWAGAGAEYRKAIQLNPSYATAHHWYAIYLIQLGRSDEAIAEIKRAQALDPLSVSIMGAAGEILFLARLYDKAIEQLGAALEMDPKFTLAHPILAEVYTHKGAYDRAIAEVGKAVELPETYRLAAIGFIRAKAGQRSEALGLLDQLLHRRDDAAFPSDVAAIYSGLGEKDAAFEWLEKAYVQRDLTLAYLKVDPRFESLRSDARYTSLLKRLGLDI